jgi:hypothetical protein
VLDLPVDTANQISDTVSVQAGTPIYIKVLSDGTVVTSPTTVLNFLGTGVSVTANGTQANITIIGSDYSNSNVISLLGAFGSNPISTTGNVSGGNMLANGSMSITGNLTVNGNATLSGNILGDRVQNGTTSFDIQTQNGNANITVAGTSNVVVFSTTGVYANGLISATGNITSNYFIGNGSQLTGLAVPYGNANVVANLAALGSNPVSTTGNITGGNIMGGANVNATTHTGTTVLVSANVTGGNLLTGGIISATGNVTGGNILTVGRVSATGNVTGNFFVGNGRQLTGVANIGDITFVNTTISAPSGDDILVQALDNDDVVNSSLLLDPNNTLTRLEQWSSQDSNSWTTSDWTTGVYTNQGGLGAVQFTGAANIVDFVNSLSGTGHIFFSVNGGPQLVYDGAGGGATDITFYTPTLPAVNPTTVTSFDYYYSYKSGVEIDYDSAEVNIYANNADINLQTTGQRDISLNSSQDVTITANSTSTWTFANTGNLTLPSGGNLIVSGAIVGSGASPAPTLSGFSSVSALTVSASGNVTVGNILTVGTISASGNVTGNFFVGNGSLLTGIAPSYGNANVVANLAALGSNPISTTGNITGNNFFGNIQGTTGDILNVTSTNLTVTNISSPNPGNAINIGAGGNNNLVVSNVLVQVQNVPLSVAGNVTGGNVLTGGLVSITGNVTANRLVATGIELTNYAWTTVATSGGTTNILSGISQQKRVWVFTGTQNQTLAMPVTAYNTVVPEFYIINKSTGQLSVEDPVGFAIITIPSGADCVLTGVSASTTGAANWHASLGALSSISVTGNIQGGNLQTAGLVSATGNVTGGNLRTVGQVSATGNITGGNILTGGLISATGSTNTLNLITRNGDANPNNGKTQIAMGYNGTTDYSQFIHTRHNAGSSLYNTIELWTSDGTQAGTFPANAILGLTVSNSRVSIGNSIVNPGNTLDVGGNLYSTGNITTAGNFVGNGAALTNVTVSVAGNIIGTQSNVTLVAGAYSTVFDNTGNLTLPGNTFAVNYANSTPVDVVTRFESTWTVATGNSTQSFTVAPSNSYQMWVDCNIANGIVAWNATATVTNTNVPVVGAQYAWVYAGGGTPINLTSIPSQFTGTANTIVSSNGVGMANTNVFSFGFNNTSGAAQTVRYGWIQIS